MSVFAKRINDDGFAKKMGLSADELERLHAKSYQQGVATASPNVRFRLQGQMFERLLDKNRPVLEIVKKQELLSPQRFYFPHLIAVTDGNGIILHISGDERSVENAERMLQIGAGASLSIGSAGTNAVSAAIELQRSVCVKGEEHYLEALKDWISLCVPVHNAERQIIALFAICTFRQIPAALLFPFAESLAALIEQEYSRSELNGKMWILESELEERLHQFNLTAREREIALYWLLDYDCKQIGRVLGISENTVRVYISKINCKMKVNSKASFILRVLGAI